MDPSLSEIVDGDDSSLSLSQPDSELSPDELLHITYPRPLNNYLYSGFSRPRRNIPPQFRNPRRPPSPPRPVLPSFSRSHDTFYPPRITLPGPQRPPIPRQLTSLVPPPSSQSILSILERSVQRSEGLANRLAAGMLRIHIK